MRWKCTFCEDCNLCQDCKSKSQSIHNHPNNHAFQPIAYSSGLFPMVNPAICDYCESACTNINTCQKCASGEFFVEEYELFQIIKKIE
ncbi:hypothetical protein GLOIN_2v1586519 [Rhizophagus irregularis DAOM 181602=DAOM 197198]|uniref:ZZ-type domain-containing protein n=4 Tax=Rhizophagus irregularis TaxID=588596 RepID=U9SRD9_RHIID|nr:hypothetical protein GLOIN_2v1586519 [Rhizophagus irregularis DAOM 181602=DAOM 197198]EXX56582.1 hypothetical protein RirG_214930 [Rhizophagus irregularis DAOM 197198w]POG73434.1 hypothetical protein GLOIN_2v1586519 [Rhizophagus irregularis DAOM 181602=DAOM 197198]|eukprot:XP_025180300.1 hypothetical protein GLOIN_2v1586519 [Rhizophagus irregularis DAOM 181602=DAOM 197198]